jgi:hypothetical protein
MQCVVRFHTPGTLLVHSPKTGIWKRLETFPIMVQNLEVSKIFCQRKIRAFGSGFTKFSFALQKNILREMPTKSFQKCRLTVSSLQKAKNIHLSSRCRLFRPISVRFIDSSSLKILPHTNFYRCNVVCLCCKATYRCFQAGLRPILMHIKCSKIATNRWLFRLKNCKNNHALRVPLYGR